MGKRFDNFWNLLTDYWCKNMEDNYKRISAGLGGMFIAILIAILIQLGAIALGLEPNWGLCIWEVIGAVKVFLIMFFIVFFGSNGKKVDSKKS